MSLTIPRPDLYVAWKKFIETGEITENINPEITEAWKRCAADGVDPLAGRNEFILDKVRLREMLENHQELIDLARPFMNNLYKFVAGSGFIVLLCDEHGYIMATVGDRDVNGDTDELNFEIGALWTEEEIGNNGVGTSLVMRKPFQVSGYEHFCRKHHKWTCSGSPIFNENREMIGILEMSGPVQKTHLHTLGMVVAATEAIEHQMQIHRQNRELIMLNNRMNSIINSVSDGVVIIDSFGEITQTNPALERILDRRLDLGGKAIENLVENTLVIRDMLVSGKGFKDVELTIRNGTTLSCLASGEVLRDEQGRITGASIFIDTIKNVHRLVNRFSGAQATFQFEDIVGDSEELMEAIRIGTRAAVSDSNVLLQGDSGTGKEIFAQAIHNRSSRANHPFVAINCGAIPRELLDSELFGYVEGAFTGAKKGGRPGKFEMASGGTLFLDEIADLPLAKQVALLRVLQERKIMRIGGDRVIPVDVRIICATNKNLLEEVKKGHFRQDLYYRLNVISITLPPLKNRKEDITLLLNHFLQTYSKRMGIPNPVVEPQVLHYLQNYSWPGNVRELQNVVERMLNISSGDKLTMEHLPPEVMPQSDYTEPEPSYIPVPTLEEERKRIKEMQAQQEIEEIISLLAACGGNVSEVARRIGISRNTLYRKMRQYNIME
ncbi:MAG: sigma-54-dependent Fis family transcriptional regulator [Syntrophomonadaceae bacterium]